MNDSCSDSETGKDIFTQIKQENNLFLNIKEEPDSHDAYYKPDPPHSANQPLGKKKLMCFSLYLCRIYA